MVWDLCRAPDRRRLAARARVGSGNWGSDRPPRRVDRCVTSPLTGGRPAMGSELGDELQQRRTGHDQSVSPVRHSIGTLILVAALISVGCGQASSSASLGPSVRPSSPTPAPTASAISIPTPAATAEPTPVSTPPPTPRPTARPTPRPTARPTSRPTARPTPRPTARPTSRPTARPTSRPTVAPTPRPPAASKLVRHGARTTNDVALTFDMGGRVGDARRSSGGWSTTTSTRRSS